LNQGGVRPKHPGYWPVRLVRFSFVPAAAKYDRASALRGRGETFSQATLANARLAAQDNHPALAGACFTEAGIQ
jgi:hypothetical protein